MAISNVTRIRSQPVENNNKPMGFGAVPIYRLANGATGADVVDQLTLKLLHLRSMLFMVHGEGAETFHSTCLELQDGHLSACYQAATECADLANVLATNHG